MTPLAAADIHNTDIQVGHRVEVQSATNYLKRDRVTAVGSGTFTGKKLGAGIAGSSVRVLPHGEIQPSTGYDWTSQQ